MRKIIVIICFCLVFLFTSVKIEAQALEAENFFFLYSGNNATGHSLCQKAIRDAEQQYQIPKGVLQSIANIESGYNKAKSKSQSYAWPWAINNAGKSYYFKSKPEAIEHVKKLQKQQKTNIDVGCMQVNLRWHGQSFNDLSQAFNPQENAHYAAYFLRKLYHRHGSWQKAIGFYHSSLTTHQNRYKSKVLAEYKRLQYPEKNLSQKLHKRSLPQRSFSQNIKKSSPFVHFFQGQKTPQKKKELKGKMPLYYLFRESS